MAADEVTTVEEWRPVMGYVGLYEVSSLGRVRSLDRTVLVHRSKGLRPERRSYTGQLLRPYSHVADYPQVKLSKNGRIKNRFIHVLVCEAFHGQRPEEQQAAHGDGNRANPRADNLRWATRSENMADTVHHGTVVRGEACSNAKLTVEKVKSIRAESVRGVRQIDLAERFNVKASTIANVVKRRNWNWVE